VVDDNVRWGDGMVNHYLITVTALDVGVGVSDGDL
jgi:hypothetical protein